MRRICALAVVLVFSGASQANAGIVNVQSSLTAPAAEGFSGSLTGSALVRGGNAEVFILRGSGTVRYRSGDHLVIGIVNGNFGKSGESTFLSNTFEHARYRLKLSDRLTGETFVQHTFNKFTRLELRALFGVGPKIDIIEKKKYSLALGVAYMLEYERIANDEVSDAGDTDTAHRASSYLTGRYEIDDRLQLVDTFYAQPRLDDVSGDYRLLNESSLVVTASKKLSFTTSFSISYDRKPPRDTKRVDTSLTSSITLSF